MRLELDTHLAQQALREALDTKEVQEARERLNHITELSHVSRNKTRLNSLKRELVEHIAEDSTTYSSSCWCKIHISVASKLKISFLSAFLLIHLLL